MNNTPPKVDEPKIEPIPSEPTPVAPQEAVPNKMAITKPNNSLKLMIPLLLVAVILAVAFPSIQTIVSQAAAKKCEPITKVLFNPGVINTFTNSRPTDISVLAYDQYNRPIWREVKYDWGISSTNSVGTVKAKHDLATFIPLHVGTGDLFVKTTNSCTPKAVIGAVKITVQLSVAPTPTIRKKK